MKVQFEWPQEVVARFTEEAQKKGLSLDAYVLQTVPHSSGSNRAPAVDDLENRRKREDAGTSIRQLRKGNTLGPGVSIRQLNDEGRRF